MTPEKNTARLAGALYLLIAIIAPIGMIWIPSVLYVRGDAAATAANIRSSELLFRTGIALGLVDNALFILLAVVLYRLLKHVGRTQAMLMLVLVVSSGTMGFLGKVNLLAVLIALSDAEFLSVFTKVQLDALAFFFVRLHGHALQVISLLWGLWLFPFGWLVYRSRFIPKVFGVLLIVNGVAYCVSSFTWLLAPDASALVNQITLPAKFAGELPIIFWLLIKGVRGRASPDLIPAPA